MGGGVGPGAAGTARPAAQPATASTPAPPSPRMAEKCRAEQRSAFRRPLVAGTAPLHPGNLRTIRRHPPSATQCSARPHRQARIFWPLMNPDERRCRRDRLRHRASRPLQNSYPRSSASIRGKIRLPSAPTRQASQTTRARAAGPCAPAIRPSRGAPTPAPTAPFKPFRTDPLNREPTAQPGRTARFKPSRIDPLNREPGAFSSPAPRPMHRVHEPAQIRASTRRAAHAESAPQARIFAADER